MPATSGASSLSPPDRSSRAGTSPTFSSANLVIRDAAASPMRSSRSHFPAPRLRLLRPCLHHYFPTVPPFLLPITRIVVSLLAVPLFGMVPVLRSASRLLCSLLRRHYCASSVDRPPFVGSRVLGNSVSLLGTLPPYGDHTRSRYTRPFLHRPFLSSMGMAFAPSRARSHEPVGTRVSARRTLPVWLPVEASCAGSRPCVLAHPAGVTLCRRPNVLGIRSLLETDLPLAPAPGVLGSLAALLG